MVNDKLIGSGYLSNSGTLSGAFLTALAQQNRARRLAKYPELRYLEAEHAAAAAAVKPPLLKAVEYKLRGIK